MKKIIFSIAILILFAGCSKEERLIDNSHSSLDLYLSDSVANEVSIYDFPSMEVKKANILSNAGITLTSPIQTIREFQRKVYFFAPKDDKMIVFDAKTDTLIKVVDFPFASGPYDISFANPADGFVMFKYAPYIANYDLVFDKIAKYIDGNSAVSSISDYKSYSFLCETVHLSVSVLDNRTYRNDSNIKLTGLPVLSTITSENELLVVTMGYTDTKPGEDPVTTPVQVHFINPDSKSLRYTRALGDKVINANEIVPTDIVSTPLGYSYVTSNKGLIRLDTRNNGNLIDVSKRIFSKIEYNAQIKSLLLLELTGTSVKLVQGSAITGVIVDDIPLPNYTNCFHMSY
ncbi:hypothetical protein EP342_03355 [bacterium]|nr:MAG: hypothetical protein EP342_03355 [bacterium]